MTNHISHNGANAMKYYLLLLLGLIGGLPAAAQYGVAGGGVTSGAVVSPVTGNFGLRVSIGQPLLGNAGPAPKLAGGIQSIGDFYQKSYENTNIVVPEQIQQVGDTFNFDLDYGAPCAFFQDGIEREWELKLTINRTVLEPLVFDAVQDNGEFHTITVKGRATEQSGKLVTLKFLALLGNDSVSSVVVESFRWTSVPRQVSRSTPGSVTLKGLCTTYGKTRLIKSPGRTSVLVAPNPVTGSSVGLRIYSEEAATGTVIITDMHGNVIASRQGVDAGSQWPHTTIDMPVIPAGTYTVTFSTPDNIARTTLLKLP
jgi:hypothetical protein